MRDAEHDSITARELVFQAALCFMVLIILFPGVFLFGELAVPWRVLYNHQPWDAYAPEGVMPAANSPTVEPILTMFYWYWQSGESIDDGEWPLWNPNQFCGMPLLANGQTAAFYPPRLLHRFLDGWVATSILVMLRIWLCGATAYLCARGIGFGIDASRFLSFGWMLAMFNMVWIYWPNPDTSAWVPVLFFGTELIIRAQYRRGFFAMAFGGACILLTGHLEAAFTVSLGIGVYFCARLIMERRTGRALFVPLLVALAAWLPALMLCAAQLIPFVEYILNSYTYASRSDSSHSVMRLFFRGLICLWVPRFFGATPEGNFWGMKEESATSFLGESVGNTNHVSYVYVGIVVWMAALCVIPSLRRSRTIRNRSAALAIAGLVGLLLALDHPLFSILHRLPVMSAAVRTHHASFLLFALVFLGAQGVDQLCRSRVRLKDLRLPAFLAVGIAAFVAATRFIEDVAAARAGMQDYVNVQLLVAVGLGGAAWVLILLLATGRRKKTAAIGLVILLCSDLLLASRGLRSTTTQDEIAVEPKIYEVLAGLDSDARYSLLTAGLLPGASQLYGIEMMQGYDAIIPERFLRFLFNSENYWEKMEATTGTRYWVFREGAMPDVTEKYRRVADADGYVVYENKESFPRAYVVGAVEQLASAEAIFERLASKDFDPALTVVTEHTVPNAPTDPQAMIGEAKITQRTGNRVVVDVNMRQEGALVLSDAYYPGWTARLDGKPTQIFPANYAFRGVVVPSGSHVVEFAYTPLSFRAGLAISTFTGVLSIIGIAWFARRRGRRKRTP